MYKSCAQYPWYPLGVLATTGEIHTASKPMPAMEEGELDVSWFYDKWKSWKRLLRKNNACDVVEMVDDALVGTATVLGEVRARGGGAILNHTYEREKERLKER